MILISNVGTWLLEEVIHKIWNVKAQAIWSNKCKILLLNFWTYRHIVFEYLQSIWVAMFAWIWFWNSGAKPGGRPRSLRDSNHESGWGLPRQNVGCEELERTWEVPPINIKFAWQAKKESCILCQFLWEVNVETKLCADTFFRVPCLDKYSMDKNTSKSRK